MKAWFRAMCYRGHHHWAPSDMSPAGQVWFHDGTWWTFPRRSPYRVPRRFESRSNPLDHEEEVVARWQECRERREFAEVEY